MSWFLYVIECVDGSLYTGISVDVQRRFAVHASGKGGRYTRSHPPRRIVAVQAFPDRGTAASAEHRVKRLTVSGKLDFCRQNPPPS